MTDEARLAVRHRPFLESAIGLVLLMSLSCTTQTDDAESARPADAAPHLPAEALFKADGWRDDLNTLNQRTRPAVLEIAYDRGAAELAWGDNLPQPLARRDGPHQGPGQYGNLDDVDFDEQVVVVWSSIESTGCSARVSAFGSAQDTIEVVELAPDGECAADDKPYRMMLAVSRAALPPAEELPNYSVELHEAPEERLEWGRIPVSTYPYSE